MWLRWEKNTIVSSSPCSSERVTRCRRRRSPRQLRRPAASPYPAQDPHQPAGPVLLPDPSLALGPGDLVLALRPGPVSGAHGATLFACGALRLSPEPAKTSWGWTHIAIQPSTGNPSAPTAVAGTAQRRQLRWSEEDGGLEKMSAGTA